MKLNEELGRSRDEVTSHQKVSGRLSGWAPLALAGTLTLGVPGECRVRTRLLATESAGSWGLCPPGRLDLCFLGASSHLPVCHLDPFFREAAVKVFGPFLIGLFVF